MRKSIVWLASYPKSGNTWTRIFLANYLSNAKEPVPINEVHRYGMGDSIAKTYHMVAGRRIDVRDVPLTMMLRQKVLQRIVANNADVNLVKTHNIRKSIKKLEIIPTKFTRSAIYIVRNPLDMVLSYARHFGISHEDATYAICHSDNANAADESTVTVFLGSWSDHVKSWTSYSPYPVLKLRYEDMLADPHAEFAKALKHLGVPVEDERLDRAVRFSSFGELSKQEKNTGFREKPAASSSFFTSGKSGQWETELDEKLVESICGVHGKTMKKNNYL